MNRLISDNLGALLVCLSMAGIVGSATAQDLAPADLDALNTATVEETLIELKKDPERVFVDHNGWLVGEKRIEGGSELWSFTPEGHDAYPAAIQRLITDGDKALKIEMNIQCDAVKSACEDLEKLFSVMNENLIAVSEKAPAIR